MFTVTFLTFPSLIFLLTSQCLPLLCGKVWIVHWRLDWLVITQWVCESEILYFRANVWWKVIRQFFKKIYTSIQNTSWVNLNLRSEHSDALPWEPHPFESLNLEGCNQCISTSCDIYGLFGLLDWLYCLEGICLKRWRSTGKGLGCYLRVHHPADLDLARALMHLWSVS